MFDGFTFTDGPEMPVGIDGHCQVTVNETHVFLATRTAFLYNWQLDEWTEVDYVPEEIVLGSCGVLNNPNFGPEVMFAAGELSFIFSLSDLEWRDGPKLPEDVVNTGSVQLADGFAAVGGLVYDGPIGESIDRIYKFSEDTYEWELLDQRLSVPRNGLVAVAVPESFC